MYLAYNRTSSISTEANLLRYPFDQRKGGDLKVNVSILPPKGGDSLCLGSSKHFRRRWANEIL
jgi:hypothetical protein